jgi:DNA polymerase elongation subunit (family B)
MNIDYKYDEKLLELKEIANGDDIEFLITLFDSKLKKRLINVREFFEDNKILTDIHYYIHPNNKYQVIVRKDFYNEFLIQLFRQELLQEIKWR